MAGIDAQRVLVLQLDGKIPSLALMRVAGHHRALGDSVEFRNARTLEAVERGLFDQHDRVYASAIFTRTAPVAERLRQVRPDAVIGGTGVDLRLKLSDAGIAEDTPPDYSIHEKYEHSVGFTQRGCRLRCSFCVVPKKEGRVARAQDIAEIWRGDPWPKNILLLDNDFFGNPEWRELIAELREGNYKVSFNQGINARFLTPETAAAIASVRYSDDQFKHRRIYTAWDNRKDEHRLVRGLQALIDAGVTPRNILVYMLIGYWPGEGEEDREHRRAVLRAMGVRPYPMPYRRTPDLLGFARWVIGAYDKRVPWDAWKASRYNPRKLGCADQMRVFS